MRKTLFTLIALTVILFCTELRPLSYGVMLITLLYLIDRLNERAVGKRIITIRREQQTPPQ